MKIKKRLGRVKGTTVVTIPLRVPATALKRIIVEDGKSGFRPIGTEHEEYSEVKINKSLLKRLTKRDIMYYYEDTDPDELNDSFDEGGDQ